MSDELHHSPSEDTVVVATPLGVIAHLEDELTLITTIVFGGTFVANRDLVSFIYESYPAVRIVVDDSLDNRLRARTDPNR